jgi:sulfate adenylyltransferase subunit 2
MKEEYKLSHLKELEAESIHIIREVAAEFENPVMLYSIGKDSSVMVRLAEKAFYPGKVPFPLMHIDSKWKFKEMIQFRDEYAKKYGWNLIVESNMEAFKAGVGPFTHGSKVHTDLMKTQALLHVAMRKSRVPRSASSLSATASTSGIPRTSVLSCGTSTTHVSTRARASAYSL